MFNLVFVKKLGLSNF